MSWREQRRLQERKYTALKLSAYICEKLNKLEGRYTANAHPSIHAFYKLALHVPEKYIMRGLASTNDWVLAKDPPIAGTDEAVKYFLGTMRKICKEHQLESGIEKWDKEQ